MTWWKIIKVEWKTQGSADGKESFYVKDKVWNEEAGLQMLSGTPTMSEFEEHLGRQLTIDDISNGIYDQNSDNVVVERFGKEAVEKLADGFIEKYIKLSDNVLDIEYSQTTVQEGINHFLRYVRYYPNGQYADEIRRQLKGKEVKRNRFGFPVV